MHDPIAAPTRGLTLLLLLFAAAVSLSARAQPGIALGDPGLAVARNSYAPINWRSRPIEESVSLIVPWFGSSPELPVDRWRTLLCVYDDNFGTGRPILVLRYNPALGAVELRVPFGPDIAGVPPVPGGPDTDGLGVARVTGVPLDEERHHCAVVSFDHAQARLTLHVASQGEGSVRSTTFPGSVREITRVRPNGKIFLGSPHPNANSHTGPIFPVAMRRGATDAGALESVWGTPGGPRLTDLTGTGNTIPDSMIFMLLATGATNYEGIAQTRSARWWYEGDGETWSTLRAPRTAIAYRDGEVTTDLAAIEPTPVFEPDKPWSGFWQMAPPADSQRIGLPAVPGFLPRLHAVLNGGRVADAALTAWGLGNSRWSTNTRIERSMSDPRPVSRSHLLGLRAARPQHDGGLVLLSLDEHASIEGFSLDERALFDDDRVTNWTRLSYGGNWAAAPGTGSPNHLAPGGSVAFAVDVPTFDHPSQSLALLLLRPRGGTVQAQMYATDADGNGGVTSSATPLPGSGVPVDTNTTHTELVLASLNATSIVVAGDTSLIRPGDLVVGEDDRAVNAVASVEGGAVELMFPWVVEPGAGETLAFGPSGYALVGFEHDAPASTSSRRGLRLEHTDGGDVTVVGAGLRSLDPNRICYVLAGRGGLGQQQQADREVPGTLGAMADALGVELFFTGLATQSAGTVPALQQQLGSRLHTHEFIGTPDVMNAQNNTLFSLDSLGTHQEVSDGALTHDSWAYLQIQDEFPGMLSQYMALWRHDPPHPNGRAMLAAGELWWDRLEASADTLLTNNGCRGDVNRDGVLSPADFSAWIIAYNNRAFIAEQNGDARITPADFSAWLVNYSRGCP